METMKNRNESPLVECTFPLREGLLAYFKLPSDLTSREAKRIEIFLMTLAVESNEDQGKDL